MASVSCHGQWTAKKITRNYKAEYVAETYCHQTPLHENLKKGSMHWPEGKIMVCFLYIASLQPTKSWDDFHGQCASTVL